MLGIQAAAHDRMAATEPRPTRPKTLLLVILVLCWQVGRGVDGIVSPDRNSAYHFLQTHGLTPLYFALNTLAVAVALAALGYIWRARSGWAQTALVALGYFAVHAVVVAVLMLRSVDRAKAAFAASREARGESVDPERVNQLFAMGWLEWRLATSLALFGAVAWLTWRRRAYVEPRK
jgi:hypothetical protein